jgi:general secretion pathway protein G
MSFIKKEGFTLIEILVVVTIIGVLFAFLGPRVTKYWGQLQEQQAKLKIGSVKEALMNYQLLFNTYPTTREGLHALVENPRPNDDRYRKENNKWPLIKEDELGHGGNEFMYSCPPEKYKTLYKHFEITWIGDGTEENPQVVEGV